MSDNLINDSIMVDAMLSYSLETLSLEEVLRPQKPSTSEPVILSDFHLFTKLPAEVRLQIWEHAFEEAIEPRLISLLDPFTPPLPKGLRGLEKKAKAVADDRAPFFHACAESRALLLRKPHHFIIPTASFQFDDPTEIVLHKFLGKNRRSRDLDLTVPRLLEATMDYYNAHPNKVPHNDRRLKLGRPFMKLESTIWFDYERDFLFLRYSRVKHDFHPDQPDWNYCGTLVSPQVKKFAIEMSRSDWDHWTHGHPIFPKKIWSRSLQTGQIDWDRHQGIEKIALWTREGCELCIFSVDSEGILGPDEWAFRLDTDYEFFKSQFGDRWSNVTWRIVFGRTVVTDAAGKERQKSVCQSLHDWRPHSTEWWEMKQVLVKQVPTGMLGKAWRKLVDSSMPTLPPGLDGDVLLTPVQGSAEEHWYGPSS